MSIELTTNNPLLDVAFFDTAVSRPISTTDYLFGAMTENCRSDLHLDGA